MISIEKINENNFQVTIDAVTKTVHDVTIPDGYYEKITDSRITPEELIRRSFEFLLKRENNTMIFRQFELPVISRYFPEYESMIKKDIKT